MERIIHGDVLSPILAYMRLNGQHKVILESIPREKENARFSILAYNPVFEIKFENGVLYQNGQVIDRDPLNFMYEVTHKSQHHSDLPFGGGAIGFVGYDMISRRQRNAYLASQSYPQEAGQSLHREKSCRNQQSR